MVSPSRDVDGEEEEEWQANDEEGVGVEAGEARLSDDALGAHRPQLDGLVRGTVVSTVAIDGGDY